MKKILFISTLFCLMASVQIYGQTLVDGIWYNFSGTQAEVVATPYGEPPYSGNIDIPNLVTINGRTTYNVTSIGDYAFASCDIWSVYVSNTLMRIGDGAFENCTNLTYISPAGMLMEIGKRAFSGCRSLTEFDISKYGQVAVIKDSAFTDCSALSTFAIPNSVNQIGNWAFAGCQNLFYLTMSDNVTSIGDYAFFGCRSLQFFVIPQNITNIGNSAFKNCSKFRTITSLNPMPPAIDETAFEGVDKTLVVLHVSAGSKEAYQEAKVWQDFNTIEEASSSNANLSSINISHAEVVIELTPAFSPNITKYTATIPYLLGDSICILAVPEDTTNAVVSVVSDPEPLYSTVSCFFDLKVGETTFTITVMAEDTITQKQYTVVVTREAMLGSNANLSSIYEGNDRFELTPAFSPDITEYTATVPYQQGDAITIGTYTEDENADVSIVAVPEPYSAYSSTFYGLKVGETTFTITVTAKDSITQKVYTIVVTREAMPIREETINIDAPGTLRSTLFDDCFSKPITKLTVTGNIDARDIYFLDSLQHITELDLGNANIVAYEGIAGWNNSTRYYLANELPEGSLSYMPDLSALTLPKTLTSIDGGVLNYYSTPLTSLSIPEGVTKIGYGFVIEMSELTTVSLPSTLTEIGGDSFLYLDSLSVVINYNPNPIDISCVFTCYTDHFGEQNFINAPTLYVPFGSGNAYKEAPIWQLFTIVELPDETQDTVAVTPTDKSARIEWKRYENAEGYRLMVYSDEAHTDTICMVEFDGAGVLKDIITYKAKSSMQAPNANLAYTVDNLLSNATYHYTLETIGLENVVLASKEGTFTTASEGTSDIDETLQDSSSAKVIGYYSLSGMRLPQEPQQGVYIIRYSNGKAEKVVKM